MAETNNTSQSQDISYAELLSKLQDDYKSNGNDDYKDVCDTSQTKR